MVKPIFSFSFSFVLIPIAKIIFLSIEIHRNYMNPIILGIGMFLTFFLTIITVSLPSYYAMFQMPLAVATLFTFIICLTLAMKG